MASPHKALYKTLLQECNKEIKEIITKYADIIDVGKGEVEYRFSEGDMVGLVEKLAKYHLPDEPSL